MGRAWLDNFIYVTLSVLRSQTVYLSITVFLSLALSQQHTLLLSHVPCFVTASCCSCSLMCLALSQHHAALALSCTLLCLSITLLLLSHVPCFVSASRCFALSCALLCLSITLHSISCRSYSHVPSFVSVLLSQVLCFVSASLTPFLLSLMCLICLVTVLVHVHCFVSTSRRSYVLRCLRVSRCSCSLCALLCPALAQHHDALSSASPQHHAAHVPCLVSAWHHAALQCSAFSPRYFPGYSIDCSTYVVTKLKLSNELEINGSEILYFFFFFFFW